MKRLEGTDARGSDPQGHFARIDRPDLLSRHVANLGRLRGLDSQAVKDVALLVAFNLRDCADDDAIRGDHVPPLLDLQPLDGIGRHRRRFGARRFVGIVGIVGIVGHRGYSFAGWATVLDA